MNREQGLTVGHPQKPNDLYQLLYHFLDSVIDDFIYNPIVNGLSCSEDDITLAMSYYLDDKSEQSAKPFKFINQAKRTDIGVYFGRRYISFNVRKFCWIEAKRLPTPHKTNRDEREYVFVDHSKKQIDGNGGIERFKLNKHGDGLPNAIMFGYIQSETFEYWEEKVNQWLQSYTSIAACNKDEKLIRINQRVNRFHSTHMRIDYRSKQKMDDITIYHFWIKL